MWELYLLVLSAVPEKGFLTGGLRDVIQAQDSSTLLKPVQAFILSQERKLNLFLLRKRISAYFPSVDTGSVFVAYLT